MIQLSKGRNEYEDDKRNKKYERIPIYISESDYIEDNDESKMLDVNNRNVQIQVKNEKLVIIVICLISFYDLWNNIYFFFHDFRWSKAKIQNCISKYQDRITKKVLKLWINWISVYKIIIDKYIYTNLTFSQRWNNIEFLYLTWKIFNENEYSSDWIHNWLEKNSFKKSLLIKSQKNYKD